MKVFLLKIYEENKNDQYEVYNGNSLKHTWNLN